MTPETQHVEGPARLELLMEALAEGSIVQVMVNYEPPACMTQFARLEMSDDLIVLKPFGLRRFDQLMKQGVGVEAALMVRSEPYRFDSHAALPVRAGDDDASPQPERSEHAIVLPERLERIARRVYYRVTPPDASSCVCKLRLDSEGFVPARLENLSLGGCLVCCDASLPASALVDRSLEIHLRFPVFERIFHFRGQLRHVQERDGASPMKLGLQFTAALVSEEMELSEILMQWQLGGGDEGPAS